MIFIKVNIYFGTRWHFTYSADKKIFFNFIWNIETKENQIMFKEFKGGETNAVCDLSFVFSKHAACKYSVPYTYEEWKVVLHACAHLPTQMFAHAHKHIQPHTHPDELYQIC